MRIIGLTGGIGSGKSTVARELAARGYAVYLCDDEAKRIVVENPAVRAQIRALLGDEVYAGDVYQTAVVLRRLSEDPSLLPRLNAIIHPAVIEDIMAKGEGLMANELLFVESAILYESGIDRICDRVVAVTAPEDLRIARVLAREKDWTADDVRRRMNRQMPESELIRRADIVLCNDGAQSVASLVDDLNSVGV